MQWARRHASGLVVAGYVVLAAEPYVAAAAHSWFWEGKHAMAPAAAAFAAGLLVALVLGQRWAWWLIAVLQAAALIAIAFDFSDPWAFVLNAVAFGLLLSPQMREHVGLRRYPTSSAGASPHSCSSR